MVTFEQVIELWLQLRVGAVMFGVGAEELSEDFLELEEELRKTIMEEHGITDPTDASLPYATILGPKSTVAFYALQKWVEGGSGEKS
jgi:hypothetical protein